MVLQAIDEVPTKIKQSIKYFTDITFILKVYQNFEFISVNGGKGIQLHWHCPKARSNYGHFSSSTIVEDVAKRTWQDMQCIPSFYDFHCSCLMIRFIHIYATWNIHLCYLKCTHIQYFHSRTSWLYAEESNHIPNRDINRSPPQLPLLISALSFVRRSVKDTKPTTACKLTFILF